MRTSIVLALALGPASLAGQAIPRWTLPVKPLTEIGVTAGDPHQELANVSSAHRLPDGRIVVANGKPLELRVFDIKGKFVQSIGHAGGGPGEFQYSLSVYPSAGDSIMIYTSGTQRWEWFAATGKLMHEMPSNPQRPYPGTLSLYKNTFWVRRLAPLACVRGLVDRLPALSGDNMREIFPDGTGRYWVRPVGSNEWTVYNGAIKAIGRVSVPERFEILEAVGGDLIGKLRDEDDVERVVAWRLSGWTQTALPAQPCMQVADSESSSIPADHPGKVTMARLKTDVRNFMTAAEAFSSDYHRYPVSLEEVAKTRYSLSRGSELRFLISNKRGYAIEIRDHDTSFRCIVMMGELIAGFPSGTLTCSQ